MSAADKDGGVRPAGDEPIVGSARVTASTFGLTTRRDVIETQDDPYVAALRAAGAIPLAKTNVPQLLIYTESDNPLYGRTNNPWDLERSCGG